ncbi:MAG: hypothetical protein F6K40_36855 [Okeania sp. SIO3I5]|uniref:hypothetical protein n=1 Tax=Okeania sp. SIO3I5 TaxID=2607805 RepID=UPI0013BA231F|nr:hypothetical protein [Okeania sp. SIO3I5]NEQ41467.1 hypothetical protein [Okeania sp. SIO3I5]
MTGLTQHKELYAICRGEWHSPLLDMEVLRKSDRETQEQYCICWVSYLNPTYKTDN